MEVVAPEHIELPIQGMSCAACAASVERALNKLDGVSASVNYATERATVEFDRAQASPDALVAAVAAGGLLREPAGRRRSSSTTRARRCADA